MKYVGLYVQKYMYIRTRERARVCVQRTCTARRGRWCMRRQGLDDARPWSNNTYTTTNTVSSEQE